MVLYPWPSLLLLLAPLSAAISSGRLRQFTVYSDPIFLRRGEVHNAYVHPKALPEAIVKKFTNKTIHLKSMQLDIVLVDNATGIRSASPLFTTYNHHHALILGPQHDLEQVFNYTKGKDPLNPRRPHAQSHGCAMKRASLESLLEHALPSHRRSRIIAFGGASGAEFRGTPTGLAFPYTYAVSNPESFMVLMHFINTHGVPKKERLWECPCTTARKIDLLNGTIDGIKPMPFSCSEELKEEQNTACSLQTYKGGYRCCEHGVFLTEDVPGSAAPRDQIEAKFTFEYYEEGTPELDDARPVASVSCCDATSGTASFHRFGNLEYDVPKCPEGMAPELCEHVISSVEAFDPPKAHSSEEPGEELELVHAWGHQHVAGLGLELYRESTGELLCRTQPQYGRGDQAGDEEGFVTGIPPCVWGPPPLAAPPRLRRSELVRTVARYNSTQEHHGVMALWIMSAAPLTNSERILV